MKQTVSDFDKEYEKEQRKKKLKIGASVFVFIAFCLFILYNALPDKMPSSENIQGIITSQTFIDTAEGKSPAVKVTLDNGKEIIVLENDGLVFKKDVEILLKKVSSTAGRDSYQFINYVH